jgi:hypothetical protein
MEECTIFYDNLKREVFGRFVFMSSHYFWKNIEESLFQFG